MNRFATFLCVLALFLIGSAGFANAATIYDFSFTGSLVNTSGQFTSTDLGNGTSLITAITGTSNGSTITALLAPGTLGGNDNLLTFPGPTLDFSGVSFIAANGDEFNLFTFGGGAAGILHPGGSFLTENGTLLVNLPAATPEPSSILLLGTGLLGLTTVRRRLA
jgi:hypothetical protein